MNWIDRQKSKILDSHRENLRVSRLLDSRDDVGIDASVHRALAVAYEISSDSVGGFDSFETTTPEVDGWWSGFFAASESLLEDWTPLAETPGTLPVPHLAAADAQQAGAVSEVAIPVTRSGTLQSEPFELASPRSISVPVNELSAFRVRDVLTAEAAATRILTWHAPASKPPATLAAEPFDAGIHALAAFQPLATTSGTLAVPPPPEISIGQMARDEHPWPQAPAALIAPQPFSAPSISKAPDALAALAKKIETPPPQAKRSRTLPMPPQLEPGILNIGPIGVESHASISPEPTWQSYSPLTHSTPPPQCEIDRSASIGGISIAAESLTAQISLPQASSRPHPVPSYYDVQTHGTDLRIPTPILVSEPYREYDPDLIQFPAPARRYEVVLEPGTVRKWWAGKLPPVPRSAPSASAPFAERLRSIIGPPVNELLADAELMLPEAPFAHQVQGISWLFSRDAGVLADQVGLGKTMQALLATRLLWRDGTIRSFVVVCPRALIPHWLAEIEKWWPQAAGAVAQVQNDDVKALLERDGEEARIKLVDFESLARAGDALTQQPLSHDLVIVDEAQQLLQAQSPGAIAVRSLRADRRWALTGLDVRKHLPLAASIFAFVRPELAERGETDAYARSIESHILRRSINDVPEMTGRFEHDLLVDLIPSQRLAYGRAEVDGAQQLRMKGDAATAQQALLSLNRLRQICSIGPEAGQSAKLERLLVDVDEIAAAGAKAVIFVHPVCAVRVADALAARGHLSLQVHDSLPKQRIDAMTLEFANDPKYRALLTPFAGPIVSGKSAQYVLLFDNAWNPVFQERLMKRVCDFKDDRKLLIRRYVAHDTVEQRLMAQVAQGRRLFWHLIDESRPAEGLGLTEEELFQVLGVRPRSQPTPAAPPRVVLEHLDLPQFEIMVARLYEKQGYKVTFDAGIEGVDLVAERVLPKAVERVAIVIKHQRTVIARTVLDQLAALVQRERSFTQGDIVTSAGFMADAPSYVRGKKLTLIDRNMLQRQCDRFAVARFVVAPA